MGKATGFIRDHWVSGILLIAPLWVLGWIVEWLLGSYWVLASSVLDWAWPELAGWQQTFISAPLALIFAMSVLLLLAVLGWSSKKVLGKKFFELINDGVVRIPILGSVYKSLNQLSAAFQQNSGSAQFSKVVYVEYPRRGSWVLAFATGTVRSGPFKGTHINLFVPTVPNPTAGFHLLIPLEDTRESGLRVDEAFRIILSMGVAEAVPPKIGTGTVSE